MERAVLVQQHKEMFTEDEVMRCVKNQHSRVHVTNYQEVLSLKGPEGSILSLVKTIVLFMSMQSL